MSNEYRDKHLLDVSSNEEPDYQTHFDKPIKLSCYEEYLDKQLVDEDWKKLDKAMESDSLPF